jgi:uncharacterized protein YecE (DUF72 family)
MSLSPLIRFGKSTWTYEGWQGQVYTRQYPKSKFAQECLREYCQYQYKEEPLFRTLGNDSTCYRPPTANQIRRYLNQMPEDFEMCLKVLHVAISRATQATGALHHTVYSAAPPDTAEDVLRSRQETTEPYTKIVEELLEMRRDTVELGRKAMAENRRAYVLVNNLALKGMRHLPLYQPSAHQLISSSIRLTRSIVRRGYRYALPSWNDELEGLWS